MDAYSNADLPVDRPGNGFRDDADVCVVDVIASGDCHGDDRSGQERGCEMEG